MAHCPIIYNIALRVIYKSLNDEKTKKLLLDLMERMVQSTENDLDDQVLALVRYKLETVPKVSR
jgi:hypothetical protein